MLTILSRAAHSRNNCGKRKLVRLCRAFSSHHGQTGGHDCPIRWNEFRTSHCSHNYHRSMNGSSSSDSLVPSTARHLHHLQQPFGSKCSSDRNVLHQKGFGATTVVDQGRRAFHSIAGASPRQMADLEERVWSAVGSNVKDPETNMYLHNLGWLHRKLTAPTKGSIQIILKLPTLLHPSLDSLESKVREEAKQEIDRWLANNNLQTEVEVDVKSTAKQPIPWTVQSGQQSQDDVNSTVGPGLANVSHFLAVYSCKGGVGKSTVAVNLAYELARLGGRVGLLDVDVYGPSLPLMVNPDDDAVRKSSLGASMVRPIEHEGVKLLSLGYVSSNSGIPGSGKSDNAAVLRGPMAGRVVTQLLKGTEWGDLDVLILDLPPGTGDVQLTVCQEVNLSFAVGVTTPSNLAIADARKGISMFNTMGIPTVAMVENMAYFECDDGCRHYPFGRGFAGDDTQTDKGLLSNTLQSENICQLPISGIANTAIDTGVPICISRPEEAKDELDAFTKLAKIVSRELFQLPYRQASSEGMVLIEDQYFDLSTIHLSADEDSLKVQFFSENGALQKRIPPENLRYLDPMSGEVSDENPSIADNGGRTNKVETVIVSTHKSNSAASDGPAKVTQERIEEKGRVGIEVTWSDGSRFIYRRSVIAIAAGGEIVES